MILGSRPALAIVALAAVLTVPITGAAQTVALGSYDRFSGALIDSLKWRAIESAPATGSPFEIVNTESRRQIVNASTTPRRGGSSTPAPSPDHRGNRL